jgi:hypothetical protein
MDPWNKLMLISSPSNSRNAGMASWVIVAAARNAASTIKKDSPMN